MSFLNLSPSVLRWSTLAAWCVVVIAAGIMGSHQTWSDSMIRQMALGFHTRGTSPVIALELADSKEMIADLLPATEDGGKDRDTVVTLVEWDFLFILGSWMFGSFNPAAGAHTKVPVPCAFNCTEPPTQKLVSLPAKTRC